MLSRLLRRLLIGQLLAGAVLGWWLATPTDPFPWLVLLAALGLPLLSTVMLAISTAVMSRAPGANGGWWRAVVGECWAWLRLGLFSLPWALSAPKLQQPLASQPPCAPQIPVLLVHGYLCNHRVWGLVARRLRQGGHPVLCVDLEPLFISIDRYAPLIEAAVTELCRQTGAQQVALVGHSMGGLAIRAWMRAAGIRRVARVITLGTPHAGTRIAQHHPSPNARQMGWRSAWLQDLATGESAGARALLRIALTPQDNIVYPQREQRLQGVPVTEFDGLGHLQLCLDARVIGWLERQLDGLLEPCAGVPA